MPRLARPQSKEELWNYLEWLTADFLKLKENHARLQKENNELLKCFKEMKDEFEDLMELMREENGQ